MSEIFVEVYSDRTMLNLLRNISDSAPYANDPEEALTDFWRLSPEAEHTFIGLTNKEAVAIMRALRELVGNISHGMTGSVESPIYVDPENTGEEGVSMLDMAFVRAEYDNADPTARVRLIFDENEGKGAMIVSHPIVLDYSPQVFDLQAAKAKRQQSDRPGKGGIHRIEKGFIHDYFVEAHLGHGVVQTKDEYVNPDDPEEGMRRVVWLEFWRE